MDAERQQVALFGGYNVQHGNLVYGGEFAFGRGDILLDDNPVYNIDDIVDIRGRVGHTFGRSMVYASVGWSTAQQSRQEGIVINSPVRVDGFSFGLGVDVMANDRVFAGAEIESRTLSADRGAVAGVSPNFTPETELDTLSLRLGVIF
ncbi:MAG: hypothetical protein KJP02_07335 [Octadecabacter sp.]|nr:hypothetical protein [Octadecabacter sp.]